MTLEESKELVKELDYGELEALREFIGERMSEIRTAGVNELAEKFEALAASELGMSTKKLLAEYRKAKRGGKPGRRKKSDDTINETETEDVLE